MNSIRYPNKLQLYADALTQASPSQLYWRARRVVWRKLGARLNAALAPPITDDRQLLKYLRPDIGRVGEATAFIRAGDRDAAVRVVADVLRNKDFGVWPLDQKHVDRAARTLDQTFPAIAREVRQGAYEALERTFEFEGSGPVTLGQEVDWNPPELGTLEQVYALHRFYHFPDLGRAYCLTKDERYVCEIEDLISQWLAAHSRPQGLPWDVLTTAFRLTSWIEAYGCVRHAPSFSDEGHLNILKAVASHAGFIARHVERDIANNHVVFEGRTLLLAASAFPEFRNAASWRMLGVRLLDRELREQVREDGVHAEQATAYHAQVMWEYLYAWTLLEDGGETVPDPWRETMSKMADFLNDITRSDGTMPMLGDSARDDPQNVRPADVLAVASVLLERPELRQHSDALTGDAVWLLGERVKSAVTDPSSQGRQSMSASYPEAGYCILRGRDPTVGAGAVFDCGPFGFRKGPGHGHADALSFEFAAFGKNLIIDPGVYTYEPGPWRDFFRGTRAHNTVVVDRTDQAYLWKAFRAYRPRPATLTRWGRENGVVYADGAFTGAILDVVHRRTIALVKEEFLVVYDQLTGKGRHESALLYHFPPSETRLLDSVGGGIACVSLHPDGPEDAVGVLVLCDSQHGDTTSVLSGVTDPIQGWISYEKGKKQPAPVLELSRQCGMPATFASVIVPFRDRPPDKLAISAKYESEGSYGAEIRLEVGGDRHVVRFSERTVEVEAGACDEGAF